MTPQGEAEYQAWIVDLLRLGGWWVDHTPDSRRNLASGAFDLLCIKPPRLVFLEVKRGGKRARRGQCGATGYGRHADGVRGGTLHRLAEGRRPDKGTGGRAGN